MGPMKESQYAECAALFKLPSCAFFSTMDSPQTKRLVRNYVKFMGLPRFELASHFLVERAILTVCTGPPNYDSSLGLEPEKVDAIVEDYISKVKMMYTLGQRAEKEIREDLKWVVAEHSSCTILLGGRMMTTSEDERIIFYPETQYMMVGWLVFYNAERMFKRIMEHTMEAIEDESYAHKGIELERDMNRLFEDEDKEDQEDHVVDHPSTPMDPFRFSYAGENSNGSVFDPVAILRDCGYSMDSWQ